MPTPENARLAVLIDADNTSKKYVKPLLEEVAKYGTPTVKRAYGDWTSNHLNGWKTELNRNAIVPIQQFAYTQGKNSTDSLLIIDAMDLLYTGNLDGVRDRVERQRLHQPRHPAARGRQGGLRPGTAQDARVVPHRVHPVHLPRGAEQGRARPEPEGEPGGDGRRDGAAAGPQKLLTSAIDATSQDDGWSHLGSVGNYLSNTYSSFDPRNYGFGRLITLLRDQDYLDVDTEGSPTVRLKPKRRPPRSSPASGRRKKTAAKKA